MPGNRIGRLAPPDPTAAFRPPYLPVQKRVACRVMFCQTRSMKKIVTLMCLMAATPPATAQSPMGAEEFDQFTRGKTFYYGVNGQSYGAEEYLPDQRVIWTFLDGRCQNGIWYEDNGMICFEYEELDERQCWTFSQQNGGLTARFGNDPSELELYEVERTARPLECPGPEVGV